MNKEERKEVYQQRTQTYIQNMGTCDFMKPFELSIKLLLCRNHFIN